MKQQTIARSLESNMGERESNKFSIAVNSKSFRILLDGLYTFKIPAIVRELSTNAYDSHIAAGNTAPFDIQLPSMMTPTFYVRDYGISMTHEEIMHLYTRVFDSSKDESNEQVGMLGLGSKSPFCYVDSFTVTAYLDGEARQYVAALDVDGIPTITHVDTFPTDEPTGVKVSLPVQTKDYNEFKNAASRVVLGFETKPNFVGVEAQPPTPVYKDGNWEVYDSKFNTDSGVYVKQGCVIYPVPVRDIGMTDLIGSYNSLVGYNYSLVVDTPIGTVDVTANREALSLDDATKQNLKVLLSAVKPAIEHYFTAHLNTFPTLLSASKEFMEISNIFKTINPSWRGTKLLTNAIDIGDEVFAVDHVWKETSIKHVSLQQIDKLVFILDTPNKVVRKRQRVKAYAQSMGIHTGRGRNYYNNEKKRVIVFTQPDKAIIDRLTNVLELKKEQFIKIDTLPDVPPPPRAKKVPGSPPIVRTGMYQCSSYGYLTKCDPTTFVKDYYWLAIDKGNDQTVNLGPWYRRASFKQVMELRDGMVKLGMPDKPLYFFTPNPQKTAAATDEFVTQMTKYITANKDTILTLVTEVVKHKKFPFAYGVTDEVKNNLFDGDKLEYKFAFPYVFDAIIVGALGKAELDAAQVEGFNQAEKLIQQYPLLVNHPDSQHYIKYIESRRKS